MTFPFFVVANLVILVLWVLFKWKYVWIPLLAFAFAYVPIRNYAPIHFGSEKPKDCIKIMSYNVCGYGGNFRYDNGYDISHYMGVNPEFGTMEDMERLISRAKRIGIKIIMTFHNVIINPIEIRICI